MLVTERPDGSTDPEPPLLSAHPWRLPILLVLAFAATVAIAAAVLREKPRATPTQVSQSRER
jgi:hypothetical protein